MIRDLFLDCLIWFDSSLFNGLSDKLRIVLHRKLHISVGLVVLEGGKEISIDFKLMFVYHGSMMVLFIGGAKPLGPSRDQDPNT